MLQKIFAIMVFAAATIFLAINGQWEGAQAGGIFLILWVIAILKPEDLKEEVTATVLCTCPAKESADPCMCKPRKK